MDKDRSRSTRCVLSMGFVLILLIAVSGLASAQSRDAATPITESAKLTASDGAAGDRFGWQVAISGGTVAVSSFAEDGLVYLFERDEGGPDNWGQVAKLTASDGVASDGVGGAVAISGDMVVIGAAYDDDKGENSGSVYLFEKPGSGWVNMTETAKLTASDGAEGDYFGQSVWISGDVLVAGAPKHAGGGSAYLFERDEGGPDNWGQVAKLTASDGAEISWFGRTVAVSGETVVVGSRADEDHGGEQSGFAYVFVKPGGGWTDMTETAKLTATGTVADDYFAEFVGISGDVVVASAGGDDANGAGSGAAYLFVKPVTGWADMTKTAKLTASDGAASDSLGSSVAISGEIVVAGARGDADGGAFTGSAYRFEKPESGWADMTETDKLIASDGAGADYFGWSAAISGETVAVGSSADDELGEDSGSAYLFFKSTIRVYLPVVLRGGP